MSMIASFIATPLIQNFLIFLGIINTPIAIQLFILVVTAVVCIMTLTAVIGILKFLFTDPDEDNGAELNLSPEASVRAVEFKAILNRMDTRLKEFEDIVTVQLPQAKARELAQAIDDTFGPTAQNEKQDAGVKALLDARDEYRRKERDLEAPKAVQNTQADHLLQEIKGKTENARQALEKTKKDEAAALEKIRIEREQDAQESQKRTETLAEQSQVVPQTCSQESDEENPEKNKKQNFPTIEAVVQVPEVEVEPCSSELKKETEEIFNLAYRIQVFDAKIAHLLSLGVTAQSISQDHRQELLKLGNTGNMPPGEIKLFLDYNFKRVEQNLQDKAAKKSVEAEEQSKSLLANETTTITSTMTSTGR